MVPVMQLPSSPVIVLFVFEQATFITGALFTYRTWTRYRFASHRYMTLTFVMWAMSSLGRLLTNALAGDIPAMSEMGWIFMNMFLLFGILTTFYSFFYFQYNHLPARANVASALGGATVLAYCNPDWFEVSRDPVSGMLTATYQPVVSLFAVPLIILFVVVFLLPIVTKMRLTSNPSTRRESATLLAVLSFLLAWAALAAASAVPLIRLVRPFLFAAGWCVWCPWSRFGRWDVVVKASTGLMGGS